LVHALGREEGLRNAGAGWSGRAPLGDQQLATMISRCRYTCSFASCCTFMRQHDAASCFTASHAPLPHLMPRCLMLHHRMLQCLTLLCLTLHCLVLHRLTCPLPTLRAENAGCLAVVMAHLRQCQRCAHAGSMRVRQIQHHHALWAVWCSLEVRELLGVLPVGCRLQRH